jgi:hypothetical protein
MDIAAAGRPTASELLRGLRDVGVELPRLMSAPLYRRRHLAWGATAEEVAGVLPGDDLFPRAQFRPTRAVTVAAEPAQVWPWLVQVGADRAGWYSLDLLDNLGRPSALKIVEDWQSTGIGQWVPMSPIGPPSDRNAFRVAAFDEPRWLLWTKPDSSWVWRLTSLPGRHARLVTRVHASYDWTRPFAALLSVVLMEFGDFAMQRRMLLGIKARAEQPSIDADG